MADGTLDGGHFQETIDRVIHEPFGSGMYMEAIPLWVLTDLWERRESFALFRRTGADN